MLRKLLAVTLLAVAVFAVPLARAQNPDAAYTIPMLYNYDLDSTTYVGCEFQGQGAVIGGRDYVSVVPVSASASTTIAATTAATVPFLLVDVGDYLVFPPAGPQGVEQTRYVVTNADDDTVTVASAITLTAARFNYRKRACGASNGWIKITGFTRVLFQIQIRQIDATTGIDYQIQGKLEGIGQEAIPLGATLTKTTTYSGWEDITYRGDYVRLAMKMNTTDDGVDTGAAAEQIDIVVHLIK